MFPLYRKYSHSKTFYQVLSKQDMVEITTLGNIYFVNKINAKILPDRNLIEDIIENANGFLVEIVESEFIEFKEFCERELKLSDF